VKLDAPNTSVFPVPIRVVGSENELSPTHHSLVTDVEKLNVPGLQLIDTFPLNATVGILVIDGRETFEGGGF
jgi:hypothetical protein